MPKAMSPQLQILHRVSPVYKLYFLYLDPLMALVGTSIITSNPQSFLEKTVPGSHDTTITPAVQMLLTNMASLYVLIALLQGGVLRLTQEKKVWLGIMAAMLISDLGHLYAAYEVAPERFWDVMVWSVDEWFANGTLALGAGLRGLFLLGVGRN